MQWFEIDGFRFVTHCSMLNPKEGTQLLESWPICKKATHCRNPFIHEFLWFLFYPFSIVPDFYFQKWGVWLRKNGHANTVLCTDFWEVSEEPRGQSHQVQPTHEAIALLRSPHNLWNLGILTGMFIALKI